MDINLLHAGLLFAVGIAGGFLNVMAGGGSLLTVPTMLFLGLPGPVANGTNRIAILAQNVSAVTTFFKRGYSNFKLSLTLAAATLPGAIIGAMVGARLDGEWFDRTVALVMIAVMISMLMPKKKTVDKGVDPENLPMKRLVMGHLGMVLVGFWGGFIQIGVGFIIMPIMNRVMGLGLVHVNMHKVFVVLVYTVAALIVFAVSVQIQWALGLALAAGMAIGGWLGARTTIGGGEKWIKIVLFVTLTAFIIRLLFF